HSELRDRRDAHRNALEAVAEPQPPRAGADRGRARQVGRFDRARPGRADPQASRRVVRYFFAVWPPAETARALETWASTLQGRVISTEKIHLTLAFLGGVDPVKAIAAAKRVEGNPHAVPIEKAQYWRHNKVVW